MERLDKAVAAARRAHEIGAPAAWVLMAEARRAMASQGPCTPPSQQPAAPALTGGRRRLLLVAGLGSSSAGTAAIRAVDTRRLGYRPADVTVFSYRGGDALVSPYGPADTRRGVDEPARRLRALVTQLTAAEPVVPVDIVAHSMGGLLVRQALATGPVLSGVGFVATLATPHGGADLAAGARRLMEGPTAPAWRGVAALLARSGVPIDMTSPSVIDLAPASDLLRRLEHAPTPQVRGAILALGARTDLVVPATRARWPGQRSVTVDVAGLPTAVHAAVPGSPSALRELVLLLSGAPPTCRSSPDRLLDALAGLFIEVTTAKVAAGLDVGDTLLEAPALVAGAPRG